ALPDAFDSVAESAMADAVDRAPDKPQLRIVAHPCDLGACALPVFGREGERANVGEERHAQARKLPRDRGEIQGARERDARLSEKGEAAGRLLGCRARDLLFGQRDMILRLALRILGVVIQVDVITDIRYEYYRL